MITITDEEQEALNYELESLRRENEYMRNVLHAPRWSGVITALCYKNHDHNSTDCLFEPIRGLNKPAEE